MKPQPIQLVTGATGLVGRRLLPLLAAPHVISRNPERASGALGCPASSWEEPLPDLVDSVIHLAGEPVLGVRWTDAKKERILRSRVDGTRRLVDGLASLSKKPRVLVSASAIGFYGNRGEEALDENARRGDGFLADVCDQWESEAKRAADLGIQVVCVRIGIVLSKDGGALASMLTPFRAGAGGPIGDGTQWMSWIHIDDLAKLLVFASEAPIDAPFSVINGVAPSPVTNAEFTKALAGELSRPSFFRVPKFAAKLAMGEMSQILLDSQRVSTCADDHGFRFTYPELRPALADLL